MRLFLSLAATAMALSSAAGAADSPYVGQWQCQVTNSPPANSQNGSWTYTFAIDIKADTTIAAEGDYEEKGTKDPFTATGNWALENGGLVVQGTALKQAGGEGPFLMLAVSEGPGKMGYAMSTDLGTLTSRCTQ